ncbi:MAG: hypothetical protein DELT_00689 [Desulfovibrio sp.]
MCLVFRAASRAILPALFLMLVTGAGTVFASGASPKLPNPGFRSLGLWGDEKNTRLDIAVWYPTHRATRDVNLEGWSFRAGMNRDPVPGLHPVILLSHNAASSRAASHDLAAHLARHGFVVIAPTHRKDNADDTSGFFHAAIYAERPVDLILALERTYADPTLAAVMDRNRIGVLGVGSGAVTALQLAGAIPDMARLPGYCGEGTMLDPLCSHWAKSFHPQMQSEFAALFADAPERLTPALEKAIAPLPARETAAATDTPATPAMENPAALPTPDIVDPAEPEKTTANPQELPRERQHVLAVGLLTPGAVDLFPDASITTVFAQVGIFAAMNDSVYASAKVAERLQALLPHRPASRIVADADFFDLQAPCPPAYLDSFPALCGHQSPTAQGARKARNDFFVRFFQKALGAPLPPPLPPDSTASKQ